jgi:hypothetical protein
VIVIQEDDDVVGKGFPTFFYFSTDRKCFTIAVVGLLVGRGELGISGRVYVRGFITMGGNGY